MAYIGKSIESGTFSVLDTSGNTYNGSNTTFNLGSQVGSPAQLLVSHDGVIQKPGTDYTLASGGTQITFTTAPASGASIFIVEISGAVGGPLDSDLNGTELILDADGDTSITADTDDQIDIKIAGSDIATLTSSTLTLKNSATGDNSTFTVNLQTAEADIAADDVIAKINFQAPNEGTGTDANLIAASIQATSEGDFSSSSNATKLEFMTGASEAATTKMSLSSAGLLRLGGSTGAQAAADNLVMQGSGDTGMSIFSGGSDKAAIYLGTDGANNDCKFEYDNDANSLVIHTAATENLRLVGGEIATGGETGPDVDAGGICIDNNANDGFSLTFKNSDVAHATTSEAEADTFMRMAKYTNDGGGAIVGYSENLTGLYIQGHSANPDTSKGGSSGSNIVLKATKNSGSGGTSHGSNENLLTIANNTNPKFIFDAEGDFHADSSSTTFDAYDDAQLVRAYDLSHGRGVIDSKFDKFVAYNHEKLAELQLVGRENDGKPNHFVNITGMQRLHNGAIWQQYEKHERLLEAVYDLAKEAVGEEKADAILDKHEVKRLQ